MLEKLTAVQPAVLTEECGPVTSSVVKFAVDSLLEGDGFELPVPREKARYPIGAQLILLWLQTRV